MVMTMITVDVGDNSGDTDCDDDGGDDNDDMKLVLGWS